MKVAQVYIEYQNMSVDSTFMYSCENFKLTKGLRVEVNFANKNIIGFVWDVFDMSIKEINTLPYPIKPILNVIDEKPFLNNEMFLLAKYMSKHCIAPIISCLDAMLPSKLKPRSSYKSPKKEMWVIYKKDVILKGKKQKEALSYLKEVKEVQRSVFNSYFGNQLSSLIEKDCVYLEERESTSSFHFVYKDEQFPLKEDQIDAIHKMQQYNGHHVYLLHGVTGSGKTEVFLQMAQNVISKGKQVLFMVPEIGLTPQMVKRVSARFKEDVAIYHSSLNNQEKYEQYKLVYEKKVNIVVGTRSSIFMPFDNLGLIIMDEEHDQSYRQDHTPKYHTKDIAIFRAKYHDCPLVLASATPSLESYARALKNVYTLVEMPNRINACFPETKLIDMKEAMQNGESHILSNTMIQAIQERLERKEQCILLLNRRGYAPILRCFDCGYVKKCPHCDMALNYHKDSNMLKCHICGYQEPRQYTCDKCGSKNIRYMGLGTQKLEEYVQSLFPKANIIRMDFDTTSKKNAHETILKQFEEYGDILLGTQMIAKGLDFERVTLVGILNGDAMLNRSDYRSVELTFDLLVQASGRSGRKDIDGEVYMQVYDANHYAIQCAVHHDYKSFFKNEMRFRHLAQYPPYTYLGAITLLHKDMEVLKEESAYIKQYFKDKNCTLLGPVELIKKMDLHRMRFVIKGKDEAFICSMMHDIYVSHKTTKQKTKLEIEMNPYILD